MRYPKNSYAAREMRRRRMEARIRLKRKICDFIGMVAISVCTEVLLFALFLL